MEPRKVKALQIAKAGGFRQAGEDLWLVPSQSHTGTYAVDFSGPTPTCTCPDFETRASVCKHAFAVDVYRNRLGVSEPVEELAYKDERDWSAYNEALVHEKETVLQLAHSLFYGLDYPNPNTRGRPRVPLSDILFGGVIYTYGRKASRQSTFDFDLCHERGLMSSRLNFRSLMRHLKNPELTPILRAALRQSALPMQFIETRFAVDATGFGTSQWDRWNREKWIAHRGNDDFALLRRDPRMKADDDPLLKEIDFKGKRVRRWLKAHACVGTATHICTDVAIASVGDALMFPELVRHTAKHFEVREVSADKAYSSKANLVVADEAGAIPFIMFRDGTGNRGGPAIWRRMYAYLIEREAEYMERYHARVQVESAFGAVKRKFGGSVRTVLTTAQQNEIYCKFIAHNLCVCTRAIFELGEEPPTFLRAS